MIYFIQSGEAGRIKIGHSTSVESRLRSIQCASPQPVRLLAQAEGGPDFERIVHRILEKHRVHMEWFEPHQDVFDVIRQVRAGEIAPAAFDANPTTLDRRERGRLMEAVLARADVAGVSRLSLFQQAALSASILHNWRKRACTPSLPTIGKLENKLAEIEAAR